MLAIYRYILYTIKGAICVFENGFFSGNCVKFNINYMEMTQLFAQFAINMMDIFQFEKLYYVAEIMMSGTRRIQV